VSTEFDYDGFLAEAEKALDQMQPSAVIARSLEHAYALAAWCVENGIEEPQIVVLEP
jgi:hypothetical protein